MSIAWRYAQAHVLIMLFSQYLLVHAEFWTQLDEFDRELWRRDCVILGL